jgi:CheY-like chemotaxis protein
MVWRVLVVEDDPDIRMSLELVLEDAGHRVRSAANGREALTQVLVEPPDVIVLDLMMPVMHGWDLVETLRSHPALGRIPLIVTSAAGEPVPPDADLVLRKPYDLDTLLTAVSHFGRSRAALDEQPAAP